MIGTIVMWGGMNNIPDGWMECKGQTLSTDLYPDLFKIIQNNFGVNPPNDQFYLPDLRGQFVRGVDGDANRDPDVAKRTDMQNPKLLSEKVGSIQSDEFRAHTHNYYHVPNRDYRLIGQPAKGADDPTTSKTEPAGGAETRPTNAYLFFIIKVSQ